MVGSWMKSTLIWLRQNHRALGTMLTVQTGTRSCCLPQHTRLSGLAAREEFQLGRQAWECRKHTEKRNPGR